MADQTVTTNKTITEIIADGLLDGDEIIINKGAIVTCTETPSVLMGNIEINYGELLLDGQNITSGNLINFVGSGGRLNGSNDRTIQVNGQGKFTVRGDWFSIGTTDGTDNQVLDLSTATGVGYWDKDGADFCIDAIPMIQVETGRRIDFDNATGTIPDVSDMIYLTSDKTVMGKVKEVGDTYLIVWLLTGTLADNDALHCQKVVDDKGPDMQISWSANVNNASGDVKEAGVYMEFGNCRSNGSNYMTAYGNGYGGIVFHHEFSTTDLTLGGATGGFKPPSGCNVRVPNTIVNTSSLTDESSGNPYASGLAFGAGHNNNETEWYQLELGGGGAIDMFICNWGNAYCQDAGASKYDAEYVGFVLGIGSNIAGSKTHFTHVLGCQATEVNAMPGIIPFGAVQDTVNGSDISFCTIIAPLIQRYNNFGGLTSLDVNIDNCIASCAGAGVLNGTNAFGYHFQTVTGGSISNCMGFGNNHASQNYWIYLLTSSNINITNFLISPTQDYSEQTTTKEMIRLTTCSALNLIGLFMVEGSSCGGHVVSVVDSFDVKVRAMGMIDDKIMLGTVSRQGAILTGLCNNVSFARCWFNKTSSVFEEYITIPTTAKNTTVFNCSNKYASEIQATGTDTKFQGVHGGPGNVSNSTDGWEDTILGSYGRSFQDAFDSDTKGTIGCIMITPSTSINNTTVIAGNPLFYKDGDLDLANGDIIEFEMDYFAKGHTGFSGTYTAATGACNRGNNEWSKTTLEFQYQLEGSAWSGTWLNVRTVSNWTSITGDIEEGVKLKFRFTATGNQGSMSMLLIDTTTTLSAQKANFYPIDQIEYTLTLTGLEIGSDVVILEAGSNNVLASVDQITGSNYSYTYQSLNNFDIGIIKQGFITQYIYNYAPSANDTSLPIKQLIDRSYV